MLRNAFITLLLLAPMAFATDEFDIDFFVGEWDGQLEYADFTTDRRVTMNARLSIEKGKDENAANLKYLFDDFGKVYRSKGYFKIDTEKNLWFNDGKLLPYTSKGNVITVVGEVIENNKKEPMRLTIRIEKNEFRITKETRKPFRFRNEYRFKRSKAVTEPFPVIAAEMLKSDVDVLRKTLEGLHPALYRYASKEEIDSAFSKFRDSIKGPIAQDKFLAKVARFLNRLRCYHTHVNPFNQSDELKRRIQGRRAHLPFYFDIVDRRIILNANASSKKLPVGSEITKINGVSTADVIERLLTITNADGNGTLGNRLSSLRLTPANGTTYALFDIYFPIFFPVKEGTFRIEAVNFETKKKESFEVFALTREERTKAMKRRYGPTPGYDAGWEARVDKDSTAYLRMSNFITWKLSFKAKDFVRDAFKEFRDKNAKTLIIDIRGNGGGDSRISTEIARYISRAKLPCKGDTRTLIRTSKPDPELLKYTSTYEPQIKEALAKGLPAAAYRKSDVDGLLEYLPDSAPCQDVEPYPNPFKGKVFMLIDSDNSSAAFSFAYFAKKLGLATLVGQTTGGNIRGFSGGSYLFTRLPNSDVEFDIPVFGYYATKEMEDSGVVPDVKIQKSPEDIGIGYDRELEAVKALIRSN